MANRTRVVIGGVDTHGRTHHAAMIDGHGWLLADAEFGAHTDGYRQLLGWLRRHGRLCSVGVEGTGTYGAGLTRFLLERGVQVLEADRPDRRTRRRRGKSDPVDAEAAADRCWPAPRPRCPNGATGSWRRSGCCAVCGPVRSRRVPRRSTS